MLYRYRCNRRLASKEGQHCGTRRTLRHPVEWYKRPPKCKSCGAELTYRDRSRSREIARDTCSCDGLHFPHRQGSLGCRHYKGPRDLEMEQFNRELGATPVINSNRGKVPF
jgi:hypothetical protein